jgi:RHS repeat-associated protein
LHRSRGGATTATLTTWYLPGFEKETNSATSTIEYKYYLSAGGRSLGVFVDHATVAAPMTPTTWPSTANGAAVTLAAGNDWRYFHQDPLGSVVAITNASGAVMEQLSYDAFGKRRNADGSDAAIVAASPYGLLPPINGEDRGYTGHEMLDSIGLVHMNGRVYDPTTGRFLSADPFIQAPGFTLSYNRYAYVMNNPLVLTDPSGFNWFDNLFNKVVHYTSIGAGDIIGNYANRRWGMKWQTSPYTRMVGAAVAMYFTYGAASSWFSTTAAYTEAGGAVITGSTTLSVGGAAAAGAVTGFVGGMIQSNGDLRAGAQGALSGGLFAGISAYYGGAWSFSRVIAQSVSGGTLSYMSGGSFKDGFKVAFVMSLASYAWSYAQVETDSLKQSACNSGGKACVYNELGELRTDGARDVDYRFNPNQEENWLTKSGMAGEGSGKHLYDPGNMLDNKYLANYVNDVSKIHDYFNSWSYDQNTGFYLSCGTGFDSMFQIYSFAGMPVAGALTLMNYAGNYYYAYDILWRQRKK